MTTKTYDMWLKEIPLEEGLSHYDILQALQKTGCNHGKTLLPKEIKGQSSTASGFITLETMEKLNFDTGKLDEHIASILNDMTKENEQGIYNFTIKGHPICVRLRRDNL